MGRTPEERQSRGAREGAGGGARPPQLPGFNSALARLPHLSFKMIILSSRVLLARWIFKSSSNFIFFSFWFSQNAEQQMSSGWCLPLKLYAQDLCHLGTK